MLKRGRVLGLSDFDVIKLFMIVSCRDAFFSYSYEKKSKLKGRELITLVVNLLRSRIFKEYIVNKDFGVNADA